MQTAAQKKKAAAKKKHPVYSADIVYSRNGSVQTIPSLTKRMKTITDTVLGLQYIWEYRSPSMAVPPHYQCRLCKVQQQQNEMIAHITGWKHCFRFIKHVHPTKISCGEEEVTKSSALKKEIKETASELEQTDGRGQVRVVIREPSEVPIFQDMKSAYPSTPLGPGPPSLLGPIPGFRPGGPLGGDFYDSPFADDFSSQGGMMSDYHGGSGEDSMRSPDRYGPDRMMREPESMQHLSNSRFGMDSRCEDLGRLFSDDLPMNSSDRMMRSKGPDSGNTLSTLLRCLDTFRIECEDDAQIVLKITQKLTDVLMDYRLRSLSSGPSMTSSRMSLSSDRFSSSISGSSRFYN